MNTTNTPQTTQIVPATVLSALSGLALKGQIFMDSKDGSYMVSIPGGRNFGGIFSPVAQVEDIGGRKMFTGVGEPAGEAKMDAFEGVVKTALHEWLKSPNDKMIQTVSLDGKGTTQIRFAKEKKSSNPKAPVAAYYLSL